MSDWWLVADREDPTKVFICYMLDGVCYPPPMFGEPKPSEHLILINTVNIAWLAHRLSKEEQYAD